MAAGCYTVTFHLVCQATVFRQSFEEPLKALLHLLGAFAMSLYLVMVICYSKIPLIALLLFCFFGGQFAGLLVSILIYCFFFKEKSKVGFVMCAGAQREFVEETAGGQQ